MKNQVICFFGFGFQMLQAKFPGEIEMEVRVQSLNGNAFFQINISEGVKVTRLGRREKLGLDAVRKVL